MLSLDHILCLHHDANYSHKHLPRRQSFISEYSWGFFTAGEQKKLRLSIFNITIKTGTNVKGSKTK